ncbi:hypothetical protein MKEN_00370800 [Mycena kentingensis (nom. inval.)]|nr:hypothetical protein MKEN_00370800 [Mycena kentingensis (nom. inval.)]
MPRWTSISSLPYELVYEIFLLCLPDGDNVPSPHIPPLLFANICRQWRLLAFSMPRLWSCIDKRFKGTLPHESSILVDPLLELWLLRARKRQIALSLHSIPPASFLDLLQRYTTIKHLSVGFPWNADCDRQAPPCGPISYPAVESLILLGPVGVPRCLTLPNLRDLHYEQTPSQAIIDMVLRSDCAGKLTTLRIHVGGTSDALAQLLRMLPAVTSLQLLELTSRGIRRRPPVVHALDDAKAVPCLTDLDIRACFSAAAYTVLVSILTQRRHRLRKVVITLHHYSSGGVEDGSIDEATWSRLNELKSDGLDLTWSHDWVYF